MSFDEGIDFNSVGYILFNFYFFINYSNIFFLSFLIVLKIRLSSFLIWIIFLYISLVEEIIGWLLNNVIVLLIRFM